jgi:hypothetical protein
MHYESTKRIESRSVEKRRSYFFVHLRESEGKRRGKKDRPERQTDEEKMFVYLLRKLIGLTKRLDKSRR